MSGEEKMKRIDCFRCHAPMNYIGREEIQLGRTSLFLRDIPNLLAGALDVEIYICSKCGKVEFFHVGSTDEDAERMDMLPQKTCPKCGGEHDFDYPKCPYCNHEYF